MTQSGEEAAHVAAINEVLDASVEEIPTISAVGYAVVSSQPGLRKSKKTNGYSLRKNGCNERLS